MTDHRHTRLALVGMGRVLARGRLVVAAEGNGSIRLDDDALLITPSGLRKGDLKPEDIVRIGFDGRVQPAHSMAPSSEWPMHVEIYRRRPDVAAICHAHPPCATAFAVARRPLDSRLMPESVMSLGDVVLAPYAEPGTTGMGRALSGPVASCDALLLANHGAVTLGRDVEEAVRRMELLERLAQVTLLADRLGGGVPLTEAEARRILGTEDGRSPTS